MTCYRYTHIRILMTPPMRIIRKQVFQVSQAEMAAITGASQATVSRWENGELEPNREHMAAIREEAARRKIKWRDEWFFSPAAISERAA